MKPVLIISGPTACGKTALTLKLPKLTDQPFEIVNFDSLLFYRELSIGTAKPSPSDQQKIPHHLIDICSVKNPMNAADFVSKSSQIIDEIHKRKSIPVLVGGSGFYLRALIKGMSDSYQPETRLLEEIQREYQEKGISQIREYLKNFDPKSYQTLHENDHYRLLRAYEYIRHTGSPFSDQKKKLDEQLPYDFSLCQFPQWQLEHIYLNIEPEEHWPIIKSRTQEMIDAGLIEEVQTLLEQGIDPNLKPLQSIGYKETVEYLRSGGGKVEDLIEKIHIATRQLAKSQRTFFQKIRPKTSFHPLKDEKNLDSKLRDWFRIISTNLQG